LKGSYCALAESDKIPESKYVEEDAKRKQSDGSSPRNVWMKYARVGT
jgi:hypothetical protein